MGMFSMCPACGSDWCQGCHCVHEQYTNLLGVSKELLRALDTAERMMDLIGYANRLRDAIAKAEGTQGA